MIYLQPELRPAFTASWRCWLGIKDERAWCLAFAIYNGANTAVEIQFALMVSVPYPPFHARERREQLRERLEAAVGISIDPGRLEKRPTFPLSVLHESGRFDAFIEVFEWTLDQALREGIGVGRYAEWREGLTRSATGPGRSLSLGTNGERLATSRLHPHRRRERERGWRRGRLVSTRSTRASEPNGPDARTTRLR